MLDLEGKILKTVKRIELKPEARNTHCAEVMLD
jgi:hypothetical protein